jgi:hypothetical protein
VTYNKCQISLIANIGYRPKPHPQLPGLELRLHHLLRLGVLSYRNSHGDDADAYGYGYDGDL